MLPRAVLAVLGLAAAGLVGAAGLGDDESAGQRAATARRVALPRAVTRVASIPLGRERQPFLSLPGLGRVSGHCPHGAALGLAYRNTSGTSQAVSVESGPSALTSTLDPHERVRPAVSTAGVQTWQIALVSKGRIAVATLTASAAALGPVTCFASARAEVLARPR